MQNDLHEFEMLALFELTPDLVCIAGEDGYFRKINPAVIQKLGYSREELFFRPIASFIHPEDREYTAGARKQLLNGKTLLNFRNRYIARNGTIIWLEWTSVFLTHRKLVFAIAKDVTATKLKEKETEEKYHAYKSMATNFKSRAETDRKHLAHELHEEVAQLAATVKMQVAWVNHLETVPDSAKEKLRATLDLSDRLVRTIRRISFSVSPSMLYDLGFAATLEWECKEFAGITGIPCQFSCECFEEDLPDAIKIDLYRICQEALNNIMEHAEASQVSVHLSCDKKSIMLRIADDGSGFDLKEKASAPGLLNMQQLAASINGNVNIISTKGKGTEVSISIKKNG